VLATAEALLSFVVKDNPSSPVSAPSGGGPSLRNRIIGLRKWFLTGKIALAEKGGIAGLISGQRFRTVLPSVYLEQMEYSPIF
jgi:hypothetical protein